ncbi:MAG: hypothetical protein ACJA08_002741 [Cyclobacteriaceae bacterium]
MTEPIPHTPKITVTKHGAESKETPSIFNRKKKTEEEKGNEPKPEILSTAFSESQLQEAWLAFKEKRTNEGAGDMEQLVLNRSIRKSAENGVLISLASPLETNILDRAEQEIVQFLRSELKNSLILMEKEVKEQEMSKKLYTSRDKFEYMAEQNPALKELKERLGLDFEY